MPKPRIPEYIPERPQELTREQLVVREAATVVDVTTDRLEELRRLLEAQNPDRLRTEKRIA